MRWMIPLAGLLWITTPSQAQETSEPVTLEHVKSRLAAETANAADVRQLQGLCNRMDEEAFLPLRAEDLGLEWPRRIMQLNSIVDDATQSAVERGFASTKGLIVTSKPCGYGRYLALNGVGAWLGISFAWWAELQATPLWLDVYGRTFKNALSLRDNFGDFEHQTPPRLFVSDENRLLIPLRLPMGAVRDEVLKSVVDQLRTVAERVQTVGIGAGQGDDTHEADIGTGSSSQ